MAKLPWMPFYPADYLLDTQLLSPAARGIWMDLICHLWRAEPRGTMTLSVSQWARLLRCSTREVMQCLEELRRHDICNAVTLSNDDVTLSSRRLLREEKRRRGAAMRVSRHREKRARNAPVTGENQKSESEVIVINQNQSSEEEREDKKKKNGGQVRDLPRQPAKSAVVWASYSEAYRRRYGVEPVRNQSVNAMLGKLVDKLGAEESPEVAAFYVSHRSGWYTEKMHPVNLLLQDAEKLRTEWATGTQALGRFDQPRTRSKNMVDYLAQRFSGRAEEA